MHHTKKQLNIRLSALMLTAMLILGSIPAARAVDMNGQCGPNLQWSLSGGRLTITGSGDMSDYSEQNLPPWYDVREQILWLSLPEGLTSVGNMAFYNCANLTAVSLPSTVRDVGDLAFCQCSGMTMLSLNTGLQSIQRYAFEQCTALPSVRLPDTVTTIGYDAFSGCTGLTYVLIPASVQQMGSGVFSYCTSLVRVDFRAVMKELPAWTFYGCDQLAGVTLPATVTQVKEDAFARCESLNVVEYGGTPKEAEQIRKDIAEGNPGFGKTGFLTTEPVETNIGSSSVREENGGYVLATTTVVNTENATITNTVSSTISGEAPVSACAEITASVVAPDGWDELVQKVKEAEEYLAEKASAGIAVESLNINAYAIKETEIPGTVLEALAGTEATLTVQNSSGGKFSVECGSIESDKVDSGAGYSYTISLADEDISKKLDGAVVYRLAFDQTNTVKAKVTVRLPGQHARSNAYLYQTNRGGLQRLQAVKVDQNNCVEFYLGSVEAEAVLYIGINVPKETDDDVLIPKTLHSEYGITVASPQVEYVITGRKSSWGMNINQVTWIMAGVMGGAVAVVGLTMFLLNKRKLKMGYVPDLDEELEN